MATPRRLLIAPDSPGYYHLVSRCVRRSWLCGRSDGGDYSHRRTWLLQRLNQLGRCFAIDVQAYAIMSNHFHLVIYSDPTEPARWSDETVVDRWLTICPPTLASGETDTVAEQRLRQLWLSDEDRLAGLRAKLGSVSVFMKLLKQPIARRANREDGCTGHFFEQRFYSGALLDDEAVLATMAYVDLNPVRAKITRHIEGCRDTSIEYRLAHSTESLEAYLKPVISGRSTPRSVPIRPDRYADLLRRIVAAETEQASEQTKRWRQRLKIIQHRQRAYGALQTLTEWLARRGLAPRERPFA